MTSGKPAKRADRPTKDEARAEAKGKEAAAREIRIDPEFRGLIIPQTRDEQAQLERNLRVGGRCRDPLVVWKGHDILLDGHHRLEICKRHGIAFDVTEVELPDRDAACAWIRDNQLGRRNMTPEAVGYLRGQHYNVEKRPHRGAGKSEEASGNGCHSKTAEDLAARYKVAPRTIRHDGEFAEALDRITVNGDDNLKTALLRREVKITRGQVKELADMDPEEQREEVARVISAGKMTRRRDDGGDEGAGGGPADPKTITLPADPSSMAKALLRRLGPTGVERVQEAIAEVLAGHRAKRQGGRAEKGPKRPGDVPSTDE